MTAPNQFQADEARHRAETAKKLVTISHALGWGGIAVLFIGTPGLAFATHSGVVASSVAIIGILAAIGGAVVGQVGRAMQGRVI